MPGNGQNYSAPHHPEMRLEPRGGQKSDASIEATLLVAAVLFQDHVARRREARFLLPKGQIRCASRLFNSRVSLGFSASHLKSKDT